MLLAHLIQAGYYGHPSGFFYGMSAGTMGSWILIIVIGIVGWIVQARLQSVFAKYARVPFPGGLTGAEVAEKMLRDNGIRNVKVTHVAGHLTDHFNPQTMTVNLSDSVYASRRRPSRPTNAATPCSMRGDTLRSNCVRNWFRSSTSRPAPRRSSSSRA